MSDYPLHTILNEESRSEQQKLQALKKQLQEIASRTTKEELSHLINQLGPKNTPAILHVATKNNYPDIVIFLLKHPFIDVNKLSAGSTFLLSMIGNKYYFRKKIREDIIDQLLQHPNIDPNKSSSYGTLPLQLAVSKYDIPLVRKLLAHPRIAVNQKNGIENENKKILTALDKAIQLEQEKIILILLVHGAAYTYQGTVSEEIHNYIIVIIQNLTNALNNAFDLQLRFEAQAKVSEILFYLYKDAKNKPDYKVDTSTQTAVTLPSMSEQPFLSQKQSIYNSLAEKLQIPLETADRLWCIHTYNSYYFKILVESFLTHNWTTPFPLKNIQSKQLALPPLNLKSSLDPQQANHDARLTMR